MEASISSDEVLHAGGFGARDDISSFLQVASDSTNSEASLRDARDYEASLLYVNSGVQVNFKLLSSSSFLPAVGGYCSGTMLSLLVNMNLIIFMLQFLILQDSDWMTEMRIKSR
ncbi:hypothetical protein Vadar_020897 [Vaccinium darrowii]|uniref:Uncharacterized protein n=1 Tax=Vaccinium darrowii TaxID=229202 RepID=A0ACB7YN61_9ERIC|nr:hypothetical protein Vadar_020897 [Vaccinium darrowii]